MRILFVNMQFGRSYAQGTERYVATLGACLRRRGHEVSVLAGDPLGLGPPMALGGTVDVEREVYAYPTRGWMAVTGMSPRRLAAWLRGHRPDVIHLNTPAHVGAGVMVACQRLSIPCVVTAHDYWWVCPKSTLLRGDGTICDGTPGAMECIRCIAAEHHRGWVRRLSRLPRLFSPMTLAFYFARAAARRMSPADMMCWLRRRSVLTGFLNAAQQVIFPSRAMQDVIAPRLSHGRWQIIPNGLEPRWFEDPRPIPAGPKPPSELTIGYAGAMSPHKAPHLLLEAVRRLGWHRARVRLAGPPADGPYAERLRRASEGLNVECVGRLSPEQMPAFLRSLDVLAMTSVWPENCPYVVLEAQAARVPVVGGRIGGLPEQIRDAGLLFEPGSVEGLASALNRVREHPDACPPPRVHTAEEMTRATEAAHEGALRDCFKRCGTGFQPAV